MCLIGRIAQDLKAVRDRSILAIGRYDRNSSGGLIFETVKRTLDMVSDYFALAELHTPVGTFVPETAHFAACIPPEDELLSHPDHTHRFVSDLGRICNYIPLLRNHIALLRPGIEPSLYSVPLLVRWHTIRKIEGVSTDLCLSAFVAQSVLDGYDSRLGTVGHPQFSYNGSDMISNGAL